MGRKKQNPEDSEKRSAILKMAGEMFLKQGFSVVSMDALAVAVPVSKRTLYNHFKDKEALFTAVMQARCMQVFTKLQQTISEGQSVEKTLTAIGQQFLDIVLRPDAINIYRIAITEAQHFPELGQLFFAQGPSRSAALISEYLSKLHKAGKLKVDDPELAATTFLSMLTNRIQMKIMLGLKKNISAVEKDTLVRYVVEVFLRGHKGTH